MCVCVNVYLWEFNVFCFICKCMCACLAQNTFALKLVSKNIMNGLVEVGIVMTGLGYGLEPPYVRSPEIVLV